MDLRLAFPTHTFSQNLTLSPLPNFQPTSSWNHSSPPPSLHTFTRSLYHHDWNLSGVLVTSCFRPYFESRHSFYLPFSSEIQRHLHLAKSSILNFRMSLMPSPPSSLGLHKFFQLTHDIVLFSFPQPHRNILWILIMFLHTDSGALNRDR